MIDSFKITGLGYLKVQTCYGNETVLLLSLYNVI
jgi:hypothetical protein